MASTNSIPRQLVGLLCLVFLCGFTVSTKIETKILILGAGPAGLRAAEQFLENGITDFIILESTEQIGGLTEQLTNFAGVTINTGDIFVWEETAEQLEKQGLSLKQFTWNAEVRNDHNEDITDEYDIRYSVLDSVRTAAYEEIGAAIHARERPDISAKTAMAMKGWLASSAIDRVTQWFDFEFSEGVAMEDMSFVGPYSQELLTEVEANWYFITDYADGIYAGLKDKLTDDNLHLNRTVTEIDQTGEKVVVTAYESGDSVSHDYTAQYVISTLSIGVLQHGVVNFNPPLPEWKTEQICRFQASVFEFIYLKFASKFWGESEWILHASEHDYEIGGGHLYPAFFNLDSEGFYPGSSIILAALTKEEARRVESLTDEQIMEEIVKVMGFMYGDENVSELEEMKFDRWLTNPAYDGTFVTWPVGNVPADMHQRLGENVGRLFFADSSASAKNIGRQTGSEEEADRDVKEIIECLDLGECPTTMYEPTPYWPTQQCEDGDQLYGCVRLPKKEGKTRKVFSDDE